MQKRSTTLITIIESDIEDGLYEVDNINNFIDYVVKNSDESILTNFQSRLDLNREYKSKNRDKIIDDLLNK